MSGSLDTPEDKGNQIVAQPAQPPIHMLVGRFAEISNIQGRYGPDIRGLRLQTAIFRDYDVGHNRIWMPYFTKEGGRMFTPHVENTREQDKVINMYVDTIMRYGVVQGVHDKLQR